MSTRKQDHPRSRDSQSTFGGLDTLNRPPLLNMSRRGRERTLDREKDGERIPSQMKTEPYSRNSDASLVYSVRTAFI